MPWLTKSEYLALLKRNDDRDFAAARAEMERVRSDVRALRTWLQRNVSTLLEPDGDEELEAPAPAQTVVDGVWHL